LHHKAPYIVDLGLSILWKTSRLHGITSEKAVLFIVTVLWTSYLTRVLLAKVICVADLLMCLCMVNWVQSVAHRKCCWGMGWAN
jgi:hypothetical protein